MRRVAGLGIVLALTACTAVLERGLSEPQADEIVVALGERGIGATTQGGRGGEGCDVVIAESDVGRALGVLREEGLPRADAAGTAEAYAEPSLIPTAGEERARRSAALAVDLARSIEALDGVHDARVHVGLPDPSVVPMDQAPPVAVASVLVRARRGATVDEAAVRAIVAGAVPGLAPERVTVVSTVMPAGTAAAEPLVALGPILVTRGSAPALRLLLGGMLAVNVVLGLAIGAVLRRRR